MHPLTSEKSGEVNVRRNAVSSATRATKDVEMKEKLLDSHKN